MSETPTQLRNVLLHDEQGIAQCILPRTSLLDLKSLHTLSGRVLMPMPDNEIMRASRMKKLTAVGQSMQFFTLPTYVDSKLSGSAELMVEDEGLTLGELRDTLHQQGMHIRHLAIAVPEEQLVSDLPETSQDSQRIADSIKQFTSLRIRQRLDETLEIPPLSPTAERIMQLRANPNASVSELTSIVEADPSLAAQVVSWASSPYYAAPGKIRSVQDAIVRVLGFDLVSNLAVGLVLGRSVDLPKDQSYGFTPYWLQAVYCSTAVESLARAIPVSERPQQGLIYLAGLLHNFGYLILAHTFPPHFTLICRYIEANPEISHVAVENHLIGISREQISAWLMQAWNMPEEISAALRYQQDASYTGDHSTYANLIFIAMRLLRRHGIGDAPPESIPDELYARLGLTAERCEAIIENIVNSDDIALIADQMAV
ncbi:HDOD domain-containing protein [Pseudohongiella spirulinae]|uniref:Putative signal transduction protein n=1 Tax=Pseudohongiella spirulinae TaxID=1249552 RepID=A0A0S2KH50_9GAMM|nr:HDOD domain-containing protein [Pseudohongiella spirulinae]ALO47654.1 Putative signal transduction protein [Pseudohongiella spirulinae]